MAIGCGGGEGTVGLIGRRGLQEIRPFLTVGKALVGQDAGVAEFGTETQERFLQPALFTGREPVRILERSGEALQGAERGFQMIQRVCCGQRSQCGLGIGETGDGGWGERFLHGELWLFRAVSLERCSGIEQGIGDDAAGDVVRVRVIVAGGKIGGEPFEM